MNKNSKIYIAGHRGLVGSALVRRLEKEGYKNLLLRTRADLDLLDLQKVNAFFKKERPEYVFLAAAKVGGILANSTSPASFIYENLLIESHIIHASYICKVKKLLFLGSSCIYPREASQPIKEEYLLTGALEETNKPYAVAKIAGITLCESYNKQYGTHFISVMPTNLYGPNDSFDPDGAHVIPALIGKFHKAKIEDKKQVEVWGSGKARREFLHVDDLADALVFLMTRYDNSRIINIGTGEDITILKLAELIKKTVGFKGKIVWDREKPNGTPRKLLNVSRLHKLGWHHSTELGEGLKKTYAWYQNNHG